MLKEGRLVRVNFEKLMTAVLVSLINVKPGEYLDLELRMDVEKLLENNW